MFKYSLKVELETNCVEIGNLYPLYGLSANTTTIQNMFHITSKLQSPLPWSISTYVLRYGMYFRFCGIAYDVMFSRDDPVARHAHS